MKKRICSLLLLSFAIVQLWSQSDTVFIKHIEDHYSDKLRYKTDTVVFDSFFKSTILYGTMVLPNTDNQIIIKSFGLSLDSISIKECKDNNLDPPSKDQILSINESSDSLVVQILLTGNCCHSFVCDAQIVDDTTINLIAIGYGTYCSCSCGFNLTYYFSKYDNDRYGNLKDIIIGGNAETRKGFR